MPVSVKDVLPPYMLHFMDLFSISLVLLSVLVIPKSIKFAKLVQPFIIKCHLELMCMNTRSLFRGFES